MMPTETIRITFGSGDYPYEVLEGSIVASYGNPGACLDGGLGGAPSGNYSNPTSARIRVTLSQPSTVTRVSLDWWKQHDLNLGRFVYLYDSNGNLIPTSNPPSNLLIDPAYVDGAQYANAWYTVSSGPISFSGVAYVEFQVHASEANVALRGRMDNCVIEFTSGGPDEHPNRGEADCPIARTGQHSIGNPIGVRHGEKREEVTDLTLNTPAGQLDFTRSYRQTKQSDYKFMGLGWTHNHLITLTKITGTPNKIVVQLPRGGNADFVETSTNHYDGVAGIDSTVDWNPSTSQYTLKTVDGSTYLFNAAGQLLSLTWPVGGTWTYTYASGKLSEVNDGHGRKLVFRYHTSGTFNGLLYRVGDHTFIDTNPNAPTGRYVQYGYTLNKVDGGGGTLANGVDGLLTSVRDVRGNTWTYNYYGQLSGETDLRQLNFLVNRQSPSVDITGDGTADGPLTLESLVYVMQGTPANPVVESITQQRGNGAVNTLYAFQPNGNNLTTEITANLEKKHVFQNGVYAGVIDPSGNTQRQQFNLQYRPDSQTDPNGNKTSLAWSSDGKRLNSVTDAQNYQTTFNYNTSNNTLNWSLDAQGRKTQYLYADSNNPRLPTDIKVIAPDGVTVLVWQKFAYDNGRVTSEKVVDPANGTTVQQEITRNYYSAGNGNGLLQTLTRKDVLNSANDISTTYTYDAVGRVIKTQQSSLQGSCQFTYTVYDDAGNVVASVCSRQSATPPTTVAAAIALYDALEPDKTHVTTYEYDPLGRRIKTTNDAGSSFAQTTYTVYDALDRVIRTIVNWDGTTNPVTTAHSAFPHGAENTLNLVTEMAYNARGLMRKQLDVLGNVTLYGYNDADRLVKTVQNAASPNYNNDYLGTAPDPSLSSYTPNGNPDQDIVTINEYDPAGNLVRTTDVFGVNSFTVYDALNRPVKMVRHAKPEARIDLNVGDSGYNAANDPRSSSYTISLDPDRDLIETTVYNALGQVLRTQRLLENRPTPEWETTFYTYDALGRQDWVIRYASQPDLILYEYSFEDDQDILSFTTYDSQGRVRSTIVSTEADRTVETRLVYDGLNRVVRSIANFVDQGEDPALWVWNSGWKKSNGTTAIGHGVNNDQNIVTDTVYNADGRVQETRDVLGRVTRTVYDLAGRVFRTIINYVPQGTSAPYNWVWNNGWKQSNAGGAPAIVHGADNDENQVTSTLYDAQGRVAQTIDHQNKGTLRLYNVLGRQVSTIVNYVVQGSSNPANWVWSSTNQRWENGAGSPINFGTDNDQNRITTTTYDLAGRVVRSRDAAGVETCYEYDTLGRRIKTTANYVDGVFNANTPDEDVVSTTSYNKAGQVISTTDTRGTTTAFTYDDAGRRLTVTQANGTALARTDYTCYDKAGRVQRQIANWSQEVNQPSPDARAAMTGAWLFAPQHNGAFNDRDLITHYSYDRANRQTQVSDPLGNLTSTAYFKDGQMKSSTDPENVVTAYRYDALRRRIRVVQSFIDQGEDPALWLWNSGWKKSNGTTAIVHGSNNDQNIIVDVAYDRVGRVTSQRDPRGNLTSYSYDKLNRRKTLTNPLSKIWTTAYAPQTDGKTTTTMTMPGITGAANYQVQRVFDRLGRPLQILYGSPSTTPDVTFGYDVAGNRVRMSEYSGASFTNRSRETTFGYDDLHRLTSVGFDNDGNGSVDQTVSYGYDAGGLRTRLTLPGNLSVTYSYDAKGQLISLTDWDNQKTAFAHDAASRMVAAERANGLRSRYHYDAGGRLRWLRHTAGKQTLAHFAYDVDKRGNRTQATEMLAQPATTNDVTISHNDKGIVANGSWANMGGFKETTQIAAALLMGFVGDEATLTMGTGPDHGFYDLYINGSLWQSFDGYAAVAGERTLQIPLSMDTNKLAHEGPHVLEIRVRRDRHLSASGNKVRFKQLVIADRGYNLHTIRYTYDALSRVREARYAPGINGGAADADLLRRYQYSFDLAGNRTQQIATVAGSATTTNYGYNGANQMTSAGAATLTYDNNGNLTSDGANAYTWDRANRLLSMGGAAYAYDGLGNRVKQTIGGIITQYLLDIQPGLAVVLAATEGANTSRYIHSLRGIHAQKDSAGNWEWMVQDGLGSVRGVVNNSVASLESRLYEPYGTPFGTSGASQTMYGFTGEPTDANGLLYLRARYYVPNLGVFTGLDLIENINQYRYVSGNPVNRIDPNGLQDMCIIGGVPQLCPYPQPPVTLLPPITWIPNPPPTVPTQPPTPVTITPKPTQTPTQPAPTWTQAPTAPPGTTTSTPTATIIPTPTEISTPIPVPLPPTSVTSAPSPLPFPSPVDTCLATATRSSTPELPIILDLGPGLNITEVKSILDRRPNHKVVAIDHETPIFYLQRMAASGALGINNQNRVEFISGDFGNPNILNGRKAVEAFSIYPNRDAGFRLLSAVTNHLISGASFYMVTELNMVYNDVYADISSVVNFNPLWTRTEAGGGVSRADIEAGINGPAIPFVSSYAPRQVSKVFDLWAFRL